VTLLGPNHPVLRLRAGLLIASKELEETMGHVYRKNSPMITRERLSSSYEQPPIVSLLRYIPCVCGPLSSHWRNLAKHAGDPGRWDEQMGCLGVAFLF
jgi:hypothetical protein